MFKIVATSAFTLWFPVAVTVMFNRLLLYLVNSISRLTSDGLGTMQVVLVMSTCVSFLYGVNWTHSYLYGSNGSGSAPFGALKRLQDRLQNQQFLLEEKRKAQKAELERQLKIPLPP